MTKPFNIHDWQAKQKRLTENDEWQKRQDALTPGKNPDAFYGDGSLDKLRKSNIDTDTERKINNFIKSLANYNDYSLQDAVNVIMRVLRNQNYDGVNEHHEEGTFPEVDQKTKDYLDKLEKTDPSAYKAVEDYIKAMGGMEENVTGGGASFSGGNGGSPTGPYSTTKAFGDTGYNKARANKKDKTEI